MQNLKSKTFSPSEQRKEACSLDEQQQGLKRLPNWRVYQVEGVDRLERSYRVQSYAANLAAVQAIGTYAERVNHHPRLEVGFKDLTVTWWSHDVHGLHEHDFISAAHCDDLLEPYLST